MFFRRFLYLVFLLVLFHKTSIAQNLVWAKAFGGASDDTYATCSITDPWNNIYTVGQFSGGGIDFDPGPATNLMSSNGYDIFVTRLRSNGNFSWARRIGGSGSDVAQSVAAGTDGSVYLTGSFQGMVDFDPFFSTSFLMTSSGAADIFICKLDSSGNFAWAKQIGSIAGEGAYSIATDALNNVYVTGYFSGTCDFDPGTATYTMTSSGTTDIYVLKLDTQGNFVWANKVGGTTNDGSRSIKLDVSGNIYTTGYFSGIVDFDPGPATYTLQSAGSNDIYINKLDNNGNLIWAHSFGGAASDGPNAMALDIIGNIYITGGFGATMDLDPGPSTFTLATTGSTDIFVLKLDNAGNFVWAGKMGGTVADEAFGIAIGISGDIYTTGTFNSGNADYDPGPGTFTLASSGLNFDIFLSRLNSSGAFISAKKIGSNGHEYGHNLITDLNGSIIMTGYFTFASGVDFDPGPATYSIASAGNDSYLCKFDDCTAAPTITSSINGNINPCANTNPTYNIFPVTGAINYMWGFPTGWSAITNSNSVLVNTLGASGTISVSAVNGCGNSNTQTLSINVLTPAPLVITTSSSIICSGQTATFTGSGANTYSWNTGSSNTVIAVSPSITTTYILNGTDASGCINSTSITQSVSLCTMLKSEMKDDFDFQLFPNPFQEKFILSGIIGNQIVTLYNALGEIIFIRETNTGNFEFNMQEQKPGIYFIKIGAKTKKLVKD